MENIINNLLKKIDVWLLISAVALMGMGLIMVTSASSVIADRTWHDSYYFARKQFYFSMLGILVLLTALGLGYKRFASVPYLWLFLTIVLLFITAATPLGKEIRGARRWLNVFSFSFQPLELAKVALVFYLADFFARKQDLVKTFSIGLLPPILVTTVLCGLLIWQPDFGGSVYLACVLFILSFVGGARFVYLVALALMGLFSGAMLVAFSSYRLDRLSFLNPFKDLHDTGYQLVQSLYAFGSGGWLGRGLGASRQKLFFLPDAHNDFIFAILGEELGFVGVSLVFLLFGIVIWRVFLLALRLGDLNQKLLSLGMGLILFWGGILNMAVVLGAAPTKGIPMPFLSYGGTHLLACYFAFGILLSLSKEVKTV